MADLWVRTFNVSDPKRHRKGFTVYKVTSIVYPRNAPEAKTNLVVWKRYSDFQKLHKDLKDRHEKLYLKDKFPAFIKPRLFGRFKDDVIEERRCAALALLEFVGVHPPLFTSQPFKKFMERSYSVPLATEQTDGVVNDPLPVQLSEYEDTISESSNHSTFTDTDSSRSAVSSPTENQSTTGEISLSGASASSPSASPRHTMHNKSENCSAGISIDASVPNAVHPSICSSGSKNKPEPVSSPLLDKTVISLCGTNTPQTVEQKESPPSCQEQLSCSALDYITQAGFHVGQAMEHESNGHFEPAFVSYKNAISLLLSGVEGDPDQDRKLLVPKKAGQYLRKAEEIYHNHLAFKHSTTSSICQLSLNSSQWNNLELPISDLQKFKILGTVSSVILVLNTHNNTPYIIKVLHKSPCPVDRRIKSITPANVPFMCGLFCFMENEHAVFLVLEQAKGGCLWDHVRPYFEVCNYNGTHTNELNTLFTAFFQKDTADSCITGNVLESLEDSNPLIGSSAAFHSKDTSDVKLNGSSTNTNHLHDSSMLSSESCDPIGFKNKDEQSFPDVLSAASENSLVVSPDVPDVLPLDGHLTTRTAHDLDTESILRSSQKLLDSVSHTLCKSENATKLSISSLDYLVTEALNASNSVSLLHKSKAVTEFKTSNNVRERKSSCSRDRKHSTVRRPRGRIHFSCDDMFEGRARALSHSLDREALHVAKQVGSTVLPIDTVRLWAAELVLALDALHRWGIVIGDLRPENLLVGRGLNLMLTYQCLWVCVDRIPHHDAIDLLYAAPEVGGIDSITPAADWWSYGALLFELLSGETLASYHPGGIMRYSTLVLPPCLSEDAGNLLRQLLRYNPQERLGVGPHGVAKLKSHSFFKNIEWNNILLLSASA